MPSSIEAAAARLLGRGDAGAARALAAAAADEASLEGLLERARTLAGDAGPWSLWAATARGVELVAAAGGEPAEPPADVLGGTAALETAAGLALPLRAGGRAIGVLVTAATAPRRRVEALADVLAQALAASAAWSALRQRDDERRQLIDHALDTVDRDRLLLAGRLHDGPLQMVTAMRLTADIARHALEDGDREAARAALARLELQAAETAADLRRMTTRLHPIVMDQLGLSGALAALAEAVEEEHGLPCVYEGPAGAWRADEARDVALYQIAREALATAARRGAAPLRLRLGAEDGRVELAVEHGPVSVSDAGERRALELGARMMRERAERAGAALRVEHGGEGPGGAWVVVPEHRPL